MVKKEILVNFLLISLGILISSLFLSYRFFPRQVSSLWELFMASQQKKNQSFIERLFDPGREFKSSGSFGRQSSVKKAKIRSWSRGKGNTSESQLTLTQDPNHLILRENILSQLILFDRHNLAEKEAWSAIKRVKGNGAYRDYEEQRFLCEILWMNYQDNRSNKSILKKLLPITFELVNRKTAYFEDSYNAGIAALLNGKINSALKYLVTAFETWPASGRARGNVYFALLIAYAVDNNSSTTFAMLNDFKENYPDWLHAETFIPDIKDLLEVYPKSPLLMVVHGRLVQNINDYATAYKVLQDVSKLKKLDTLTQAMVSEWLSEIEGEKP